MVIRRKIHEGISLLNDHIRRVKLRPYILSELSTRHYSTPCKHTFIGYYDVQPENFDASKILVTSTDHDGVLAGEPLAEVGTITRESGEYRKIATTRAWCWQQGCRAQWVTDDNILINNYSSGRHISQIINSFTGVVEHQNSTPIYDIHLGKGKVLSLNFALLHKMRPGYGYSTCRDHLREVDSSRDGIFLGDLEGDNAELLLSTREIANWKATPTMAHAEHYVNHLKFAPSGTWFIFYHFWIANGVRYARCLRASLSGKISDVNLSSDTMSHYSFLADDRLLIFCDAAGPGYYLSDESMSEFQRVFRGLCLDGHPTMISENSLITDTYPSRYLKEQSLIFATPDGASTIAKVFSPSQYREEFRCDLHPRISRDGKSIYIDTHGVNGRNVVEVLLEESI